MAISAAQHNSEARRGGVSISDFDHGHDQFIQSALSHVLNPPPIMEQERRVRVGAVRIMSFHSLDQTSLFLYRSSSIWTGNGHWLRVFQLLISESFL